MTKTIITFTRPWRTYLQGEVAGFDEDELYQIPKKYYEIGNKVSSKKTTDTEQPEVQSDQGLEGDFGETDFGKDDSKIKQALVKAGFENADSVTSGYASDKLDLANIGLTKAQQKAVQTVLSLE